MGYDAGKLVHIAQKFLEMIGEQSPTGEIHVRVRDGVVMSVIPMFEYRRPKNN